MVKFILQVIKKSLKIESSRFLKNETSTLRFLNVSFNFPQDLNPLSREFWYDGIGTTEKFFLNCLKASVYATLKEVVSSHG